MSQPTGIALAPDGRRVAVWGAGRLSVVEPATWSTRALEIGEISGAVFAGGELLIASPADGATCLRALDAVELAPRGELRVAGTARVAAGHGADAILIAGGVERIRTGPLRCEPVPAPAGVDRVLAIDGGRYLLGAGVRTWIWDPAAADAPGAAPLALPEDLLDAGVYAQRRELWALTRDGGLELRRIVDGRGHRPALPGPASRVWSHPLSAWLVVRIADELYKLHATTGTCEALGVALGRAHVLHAEGINACLWRQTDEGLDSIDIASTHPTRPEARRAPPGVASAAEDRPWSEATELLTGAGPRAPAPPAPPAPARVPAPALPASIDDWRRGLVAWSAEVLAGATPPTPATPVTQLAARLGLPPSSARILAILYGRWLAGEGFQGVAAVLLAAASSAPTEDAWAEAVGRGPLSRHGLVTCRGGRLRLTRAAADRLAPGPGSEGPSGT